MGCHFPLQGTFLTQGLNPCLLCLLHLQEVSLPLSHLGVLSLTNDNFKNILFEILLSFLERQQGIHYFSSGMVSQGPSYASIFSKKVYNTETGVTHTHTHTHTHTQRGCYRDIREEYLSQPSFRILQKLSRSEGLS